MAALKKKLKKIIGLATVGVLFTGIGLGILTRENNSKVSPGQPSNQDYRSVDNYVPDLHIGTEQSKPVCRDVLEKNENTLVFEEYSKGEVAECMFVGCGGFF